MIRDFETIIRYARGAGPQTLAVAAAEDDDVLKAVEYARQEGIINAILIGDKEKIETILKENNIACEEYEIIDEKDKKEACNKAVELVKTGCALTIMKGFVDTSIILKAVLNKETGLHVEGLLSHVGVLKVDKFDRFFVIS
ncbi:MAG: phosphate acyltransferase, partial [Lutispora sp.]|nr:phosphate acyltransferase [Lutispora sp.]